MEGEDEIEFTSTEEIEKIQPEMSVELIGYVDGIEAAKSVGQNSEIFKFTLNNGDGMRMQIVAWNDEISRVAKEVVLDNIIHLENAKSKKTTPYNHGNFTNAEIVIQKYTIVENLGKIDKSKLKLGSVNPNNDKLMMIPLNKFTDSLLPKRFRTTGYLKNNFSLLNSENSIPQKACCSITDGLYKLDISINFYKPSNIERGDKVVIAGSATFLNDTVNFLVESMVDIVKLQEEKKSLSWLLKGKKLINSGAHANKKQKI
ncbi:uncharacterized protein LOC130676966 [Microplitis mediator]|uniref:uncharacterized protein LOC130676966 n=1 Tax=Microplitis mediator TaxID=375433 RepID=UPI0025572598|nr:uncharacterized protein LOC130676966 [Microplitis mediator]